jgi:hypothetical protein
VSNGTVQMTLRYTYVPLGFGNDDNA